jgi:phage portal protein BeeE
LGNRKLGYLYTEGGHLSGNDPVPLMLDEVSHFMPIPDPLASFRGMSWLTPVVREIENDSLMNTHKRKFYENGATPNMIIKHADGADREAIIAFNKRLQEENSGIDNAYKTLNLYPGADATVVGKDMVQVDFKQVQGAGETRIAAAAGVPPVIVGLSEGLQAATYSNYSQARRRFGDGTIHPLWQNAAGSLAPLMPDMGAATRLWYDADNIPFLREDEKDAAEIQGTRASTVNALITAGYEPTSVIAAVEADDFRLLVHTGMYSVQLQKPGAPGQQQLPTPAEEVTA